MSTTTPDRWYSVFTVQTVVGELLMQPLEAKVAFELAGEVKVIERVGDRIAVGVGHRGDQWVREGMSRHWRPV